MRVKQLLAYVCLCFCVLLLRTGNCLRVDKHVQLDKSGWRTIDVTTINDAQDSSPRFELLNNYHGNEKQSSNNSKRNQTVIITASSLFKSSLPTSTTTSKANNNHTSKNKKLIEWDDDELNDLKDHSSLKPFMSVHESLRPTATVGQQQDDDDDDDFSLLSKSKLITKQHHQRGKLSSSKFSRLIFHGQIKENNTTIKVVNGIKMSINTHKPLVINRSSSSSSSSSDPVVVVAAAAAAAAAVPQEEPTSMSPNWTYEAPKRTKLKATAAASEKATNHTNVETNKGSVVMELTTSRSDWKPIMVNPSIRRFKNKGNNNIVSEQQIKLTESNEEKLSSSLSNEDKLSDSVKVATTTTNSNKKVINAGENWKPIIAKAGGSKQLIDVDNNQQQDLPSSEESPNTSSNSSSSSSTSKVSSSTVRQDQHHYHHQLPASNDVSGVIYGKRTVNIPRQLGSIEEPFDADDDGIIIATDSRKQKSMDEQQVESKTTSSSSEKSNNNKWTPVEITTTTTTTPPSSPSAAINGTGGGHQMEPAAQRSASDLNYIYSASQPDWLTPGRQSSNGYYSNYVIQPQQPAQIQEPQQQVSPSPITMPIIDNTSGQTPEMISDREPDIGNPPTSLSNGGGGGDYSLPQPSAASFQPAQPPPNRPSYGLYGGGYDSGSYYGRPQQQQQAQQQVAQTQPISRSQQQQVVRQEHHYHYYNNNQQQPPSSSSQFADRSQQQSNQQFQAHNVIREIQPLFISQPIIQQQSSSTTPAPTQQIIREIIKEVPVQATQALPPLPMPMPMSMPVQQFQTIPMPMPIPTRILVPQPVPIPMVGTREVETSAYAAYSPTAPAQRIIRQLSNSIPAVRLQVPTIRLPMPAIQLPVRLASNPAPVTRQTGSFVIPPMPKKTTTFLTETQAMPTHTTIMHTTQFTPATRTTVYTTEHQTPPQTMAAQTGYRKK